MVARQVAAPLEGSIAATREFAFSQADFRKLSLLAYRYAGITLPESKQNLVYGRLSRRLRTLQLSSFAEYLNFLEAHSEELENFINSISTNFTKFFREAHHFDHFRTHVAVPFSHAAGAGIERRLRVWSAGCSSGEEPYTIAIVLKREIRNIGSHDARILATDIDTEVLKRAAHGEFAISAFDDVPKAYRSHFVPGAGVAKADKLVIDEGIRTLVAFRRLNLIEPWPFRGLFDAIFCRNVMIYFDAQTKSNLIERFTRQLKPNGWLYIGHSESFVGQHSGLKSIGRSIYRRAE